MLRAMGIGSGAGTLEAGCAAGKMKEPAAAYLDHRVWFRFGHGVGVGFRHCLAPGDDSRNETQTRFALDRCRRDACAPFGLPGALSRRSSSYREAV